MVSVSCTAVCYVTVIILFIKKVWVVPPIFLEGGGGSDPPDPPVVAPLIRSWYSCHPCDVARCIARTAMFARTAEQPRYTGVRVTTRWVLNSV